MENFVLVAANKTETAIYVMIAVCVEKDGEMGMESAVFIVIKRAFGWVDKPEPEEILEEILAEAEEE